MQILDLKKTQAGIDLNEIQPPNSAGTAESDGLKSGKELVNSCQNPPISDDDIEGRERCYVEVLEKNEGVNHHASNKVVTEEDEQYQDHFSESPKSTKPSSSKKVGTENKMAYQMDDDEYWVVQSEDEEDEYRVIHLEDEEDLDKLSIEEECQELLKSIHLTGNTNFHQEGQEVTNKQGLSPRGFHQIKGFNYKAVISANRPLTRSQRSRGR
ncbi:hypothetical protein FXO37_25648 [Capsicum annuum]|nr:hypothetical protein FXO37_25648 [Capsicum annuum]